MTTLYKHQIYCLHGRAGQITANLLASATIIPVAPGVLDDVTIVVGAEIQLRDGTNQSPELIITAIDMNARTITVNAPVGREFQSETPTSVYRMPHAVQAWTETSAQLTRCPEDSSHPVQPGSGITLETRAPHEVKIIQSTLGLGTFEVVGKRLDLNPGETGSIEFSWPYDVTIKEMEGYFDSDNTGDSVDVVSSPDENVGGLAADAAVGATVLAVAEDVIRKARRALMCKVTEGGVTNDLGRIVSADENKLTITVQTATRDAFTTAASVLLTRAHTVGMSVPPFRVPVSMGGNEILGSNLLANMKIRVTYKNTGLSSSKALILVKFLS
jgi:hypothetical protein